MENAMVKKETEVLSLADIKKYIAIGATDKELFMFMGICKSYGLNPFKREIHFIKRSFKDNQGNWQEKGDAVVGYEVYLKRAERTGQLDGWKCHIEKDTMGEKAVIEIKRKDQSTPIIWEVYRKEFDTGKSTWLKMPTFMLKKVCIAQGFRLAFPDEMGGLPIIPEEIPVHPEQVTYTEMTSEGLEKKDMMVEPEKTPLEVVSNEITPTPDEGEPSVVISPKQRDRMFTITKASGWSVNELRDYLKDNYNITESNKTPLVVYDKIIKHIRDNDKVKVS